MIQFVLWNQRKPSTILKKSHQLCKTSNNTTYDVGTFVILLWMKKTSSFTSTENINDGIKIKRQTEYEKVALGIKSEWNS